MSKPLGLEEAPARYVSPSRMQKRTPGASLKARVQIGAGGRIVIPADMRVAMNVAEGDVLTARVVDGELHLFSRETAVRKVQAMVRQHVPEGVSLSDELIAERRQEARRELDE